MRGDLALGPEVRRLLSAFKVEAGSAAAQQTAAESWPLACDVQALLREYPDFFEPKLEPPHPRSEPTSSRPRVANLEGDLSDEDEVERVIRQLEPLVDQGPLSEPTQLLLLARLRALHGRRSAQVKFALDRVDWDGLSTAEEEEEEVVIVREDEKRPHELDPTEELWKGVDRLGRLRDKLKIRFKDPLDELVTAQLGIDLYRRLFWTYHQMEAGSKGVNLELARPALAQVLAAACPPEARNAFVDEVMRYFSRSVSKDLAFLTDLREDKGARNADLCHLHQAYTARRAAEVFADRGVGEIASGSANPPARKPDYLIIGSAPGAQKSAPILWGFKRSGKRRLVLVSTASAIRGTWTTPQRGGRVGEIDRWLNGVEVVVGLDECLAHAEAQMGRRRKEDASEPLTVYAFNFENIDAKRMKRFAEALRYLGETCLGIDEIHHIKVRKGDEPTATRLAMECLLEVPDMPIVGASGTLLPNEVEELRSLFRYVSHGAEEFDPVPCTGESEAEQARCYEKCLSHMVRFQTEDVVFNLPRLRIETNRFIEVPENLERKLIEIHSRPIGDATAATAQLNDARALLVEARSMAMVNLIKEHDRDYGRGKWLVFSTLVEKGSRQIVKVLREHFMEHEVGEVDGTIINQHDRERRFQLFQQATGGTRLLSATSVAEESVNLTSAHRGIDMDLPWTYAAFRQRFGRLWRPGQLEDVVYFVLLCTTRIQIVDKSTGKRRPLRTLDEVLWPFVLAKQRISDVAVDGKLPLDGEKLVNAALGKWLEANRLKEGEAYIINTYPELSRDQQMRLGDGRLRFTRAGDAHEWFRDEAFTRIYLEQLRQSPSSAMAAKWLPQLLRGGSITRDTQAVDLGCGNHLLQGKLGCRLVGVDRHPRSDLSNYIQGTFEELPLPSRSADLLIRCNSLQGAAEDLVHYLKEDRRIARPGAQLWVVEDYTSMTTKGFEEFLKGMNLMGWVWRQRHTKRFKNGVVLRAMQFDLRTPVVEHPDPAFFRRTVLGTS